MTNLRPIVVGLIESLITDYGFSSCAAPEVNDDTDPPTWNIGMFNHFSIMPLALFVAWMDDAQEAKQQLEEYGYDWAEEEMEGTLDYDDEDDYTDECYLADPLSYGENLLKEDAEEEEFGANTDELRDSIRLFAGVIKLVLQSMEEQSGELKSYIDKMMDGKPDLGALVTQVKTNSVLFAEGVKQIEEALGDVEDFESGEGEEG
jgi:hypothetical protein